MRFRRFASVTLMPDTEEPSGSVVTRNSTPATVQAATQPPLTVPGGSGGVPPEMTSRRGRGRAALGPAGGPDRQDIAPGVDDDLGIPTRPRVAAAELSRVGRQRLGQRDGQRHGGVGGQHNRLAGPVDAESGGHAERGGRGRHDQSPDDATAGRLADPPVAGPQGGLVAGQVGGQQQPAVDVARLPEGRGEVGAEGEGGHLAPPHRSPGCYPGEGDDL